MSWQYDPKTKTYIDPEGNRLTQGTLTNVRDAYLDQMEQLLNDYAENLANGTWSMATFEREMRRRLKDAHVAEYVLGRGGAAQMTAADWGVLGARLKGQYKYLRGFLSDLQAGTQTKDGAAARAKNYIGAARSSFSRGRAKSYGFEPPYHPGDGGTPCHGNCRCHWTIEEDETEIRAYWITSTDPCSGCQSRASESAPFTFIKESAIG